MHCVMSDAASCCIVKYTCISYTFVTYVTYVMINLQQHLHTCV